MRRVAFYTLGCKVNTYDSAYMQALFLRNGYDTVDFGQTADIIVINTCTVTAMADKKSRAAIRRATRNGHVIVVGCLAQKSADAMLEIDGVSAVLGTDERSRIVDVAEQILSGQQSINGTHTLTGCGYEPMHIDTPGEKTRGIVKIQEGCDCFCSYCVIPYVRGRSRSRAFADIISEAETLAGAGVKELVLTGIHIASYLDGSKKLGDVITALDHIGARLRLGSIEPGILDKDFVITAASAKNLCPHFHLSLQSGSASVLKRMNRPYTPEEYMGFVDLIRAYFDRPAITTDVIAGFPAETEDEHEETMKFVQKAAFSRLHVFPFSAREGTKAYNMSPKVPKAEARRRAAELIVLGDRLEDAYIRSMRGETADVVFEEPSSVFQGCVEGYSERYIRVAAEAEENQLKTVTIKEIRGKTAMGE